MLTSFTWSYICINIKQSGLSCVNMHAKMSNAIFRAPAWRPKGSKGPLESSVFFHWYFCACNPKLDTFNVLEVQHLPTLLPLIRKVYDWCFCDDLVHWALTEHPMDQRLEQRHTAKMIIQVSNKRKCSPLGLNPKKLAWSATLQRLFFFLLLEQVLHLLNFFLALSEFLLLSPGSSELLLWLINCCLQFLHLCLRWCFVESFNTLYIWFEH